MEGLPDMSYGESPGQRIEERTRELMNLPEHMIMQSLRAEVDSTLEFSDVGSYLISLAECRCRAIEMREWLFKSCLVFHRRVLHTHALSQNVRKTLCCSSFSFQMRSMHVVDIPDFI